jgi:nicotinate dehydrogenase subunit B
MNDQPSLGGLHDNPSLDAWVTFEGDANVIIRSGKAELGQGLRTALTALAADELGVDPARIRVQCAATRESPNEGNTGGSRSIEQSGTAVRQACAHARRILIARAADELGCPPYELGVDDGAISTPDGRRVSYWELMRDRRFDVEVDEWIEPVPVAERRYVGHGLPRVDLPAKLRGEPVFVHDQAPPGVRHARVIRPPRIGARIVAVGASPPGTDIVRRGDFLAVVADDVATAIGGAELVGRTTTWTGGERVPEGCDTSDYLESHVVTSALIVDGASTTDPIGERLAHEGAASIVSGRYSKPFTLHGSIGPSAAIAHLADGRLSIWSHSQNVEALSGSVADVIEIDPTCVDVRHVDGAGCYGHNGADDVALDAALVAVALPGTPVSVVWSRADEHGWEPLGPAMSVRLDAGLDTTGRVTSWQHELFSYAHGARPRSLGPDRSGLLAAWYLDRPITRPEPRHGSGTHSGAHRNADPIYAVGSRRVVSHLVAGLHPRTSSLRALGAFGNVFAIESFVDEVAAAVGSDPIDFRLQHLADDRARAVIELVSEMADGLIAPGGLDAPGRGFAFARYKNSKAYVAVIVELGVVARTGEIQLLRAWIAADAGEVVDPDGLVNQLEGGLVQAASWTIKERVQLDRDGVSSRDWDSYPILKFSEVPEITTRLIDHPGEPSLGAGEAIAGPTAAAIANAVYQATGARLRDLPFEPQRVRAALDALM